MRGGVDPAERAPDLDGLRARLDIMVAIERLQGAADHSHAANAAGERRRAAATIGGNQEELVRPEAPGGRARTRPGTAKTIAWGLELPALARRRFLADSGCALADVGKKPQGGDGPAPRHPAAKVLALWRADLADDRAWRYEYENRAWGYAALRWLLVDPGDAVGFPGQRPASRDNVGMGDVARLCAASGQAAEVAEAIWRRAGASGAGQLPERGRWPPPARALPAASTGNCWRRRPKGHAARRMPDRTPAGRWPRSPRHTSFRALRAGSGRRRPAAGAPPFFAP